MSLRHAVEKVLEGKDDIDVFVEGYGRLKLSTLKRMVSRDIDDMKKNISRGSFSNVIHMIESGVLLNKLKAIKAGEEALDD